MNTGRFKKGGFPDNAKGWDKLLSEYNFGLWEFAFCIAELIKSEDPRLGYKPGLIKLPMKRHNPCEYLEILERRIKRFENLKFHILKELLQFYKEWLPTPTRIPAAELVGQLIKIFKLQDFFSVLDHEIQDLENKYSQKKIWRKRGHPLGLRYIIGSIMAQILRDKKGAKWYLILSLLNWFFVNLQDADYAYLLGNTRSFLDYSKFSKEYQIIKKDGERRKGILEYKRKFFPEPRLKNYKRIIFHKDHIEIGPYVDIGDPIITFPSGKELILSKR